MVIVFGSVNLDVIHAVDELPRPGQTVNGRDVTIQPGGKGANQAAAAALDGATVGFAGAVGHDSAAETALAGLKTAGVDLSRVARTDVHTGMASICVDKAGQNQIAVGSGANLLARADQVADADLGPGTTLVLQMEVDPAQTAALIRRARGARIVLNLAPAGAIADDALRMVDWLVVNADEAAWLGEHLGVPPDAASLHTALGVGVVRTLGSEGIDAASTAGMVRVDALKLDVVDTTGAGDCFVGVFAGALEIGASVEGALRRANVAAGLSCLRKGSQRSFPSNVEISAALVIKRARLPAQH
jgi:ribokinase